MAFAKEYAQIYDALYASKDYDQEVQFLVSVLKKNGCSAPAPILDFGCGTGNHSVRLAKLGFKIHGVDNSEAMLDLAKTKSENLDLSFSKRFPTVTPFQAILSLFAVPNYFVEAGEMEAHLGLFHKNLSDKGLLILECWNGASAPFLCQGTSEKEFLFKGEKVTRKSSVEVDWLSQKVTVKYRWKIPSSPESSFSEIHYLRYETPQSLKERCWRCGFDLISILPAYENRPPTLQDFNLLYVFKKI